MTLLNVVKIHQLDFNMVMIEIAILYLLIVTKTSGINITKGDKIYEIIAFNDHERSVLYTIQINNDSVIFLNGVTNEAARPMQVLVEGCCTKNFENTLKLEGIEYTIHDELSPIFINQNESYYYKANGFLQWENIGSYIDKIKKGNPLLDKHIITNTYEKRPIPVFSIIKRKANPAVVIIGGESGKDWLAIAVVFDVINILVTQKYHSILDYYSFYFLPILNPDGYAYSMSKDRFWDKNRKLFFPKKECEDIQDTYAVGVNIERNWYFAKSLGPDDGNECSSVYFGHKPISEEETKALANFLNKVATKLMAYFIVKGFGGRLISLPYSDPTMDSNNHGVVMEIIMSACEKVYKEYNSTYHHGKTSRFFYNVSGNSADWVKKHFNIPIVSTIHMRYENEYFPNSIRVHHQSLELITIINEILTISKEIYGPLFNHQNDIFQYSITIIVTLVLINCII